MQQPEAVVAELRARGELWDAGPGLAGMRGDLANLHASVSAAIAEIASADSAEMWFMPQGMSFATLERARYFESFPQWLTAASHLSGDETVLQRVARAERPAHEAALSLETAAAALPPAVCYHAYAALADSTLESPVLITAEETCWRHEGNRLAALERSWAFRMREIVFLGEPEDAEAFRITGIERAEAFAESLGLETRTVLATDPFFAPTSRGKALLQRVKALKHELVISRTDGSPLAISSFNNHERFFGEAFTIRLPDHQPTTTACVAFGIERWMLAILMTHGTDSANWPELGLATSALRGNQS